MEIKDEDLIRFCLHMKQKRASLSATWNNAQLGLELLNEMGDFIRSDPTLNALTNEQKEKLFGIFQLFTPEYQTSYRYSRNYSRSCVYDPYPIYTPYFIFWWPQPSSRNSHSMNDDGKLLLFIFAIIVAACALIAAVKTFLEIANNIDSIAHKEGTDRALLNLTALAIIFAITTYIAISFLFPALVFGNPEYLSAIITAGVGMVFAYGVYCLVDLLTNFFLPINPSNPYAKFTMTPQEAVNLNYKNIDSLKARAAIVMLNSEIPSNSSPKMTISSMFNHNNINTIRQIRNGELSEICIANQLIDLKKGPVEAEATLIPDSVYTDAVVLCPFVDYQENSTPSVPSWLLENC